MNTRQQIQSWLAMALFATIIVLLVSTDSWTHCLYDHHDSATFFAGGKAWMNGMVPYVDFSDSKGPLLWLIYGVGYLLSHRSVHGVLLLTCLCYAFIFWWLFKLARIYLADNHRAAIASMLTAISIFFPWVRYETRAEDFCLFFMVWALYHVCRLLHDHEVGARNQTRQASIVLGIGMAATLLIKYNVTAVMGVMALFVLHFAWRNHTRLWRAMGWMAISFALFLAPFVIYMLAVGCFDDFIREYFVANMEVVAHQHAHMQHPIFQLIAHRYTAGVYLLINGISAIAAAWLSPRYRVFPFMVFLATVLLTVTNAFWLYYYAICGIFLVFGVTVLLRHYPVNRGKKSLCIMNYALCIAIILAMHLACRGSWWFKGKAEQKAYNDYVQLMAQVRQPRVIYYNMHGAAFGIPVQSLPGCKYWVSQSGATVAMRQNQLDAIKNKEADFIFSLKEHDNPALFDSLGYCRHDNASALPMLLYARKLPEAK